jgi:hypothetical protein
MNIQYTDLAAEYLREVDQRLAGLPVLQRRELLADLRAHIETERVERNLSESELIEVLERLGSPEVIAAAAHEEAAAQGRPGDAGGYGWAQPAGDAPVYGWGAPIGDASAYGWPSPPSDAGPPREQGGPRRTWLIAMAVAGVLVAGFLLLGAIFVARGTDAPVSEMGTVEPVELAPPAVDLPEPTIGR